MKKIIMTMGVIGVICAILLSLGSIYIIAPPFGDLRVMLAKNRDAEPFSTIQKKRIEKALNIGLARYNSEKKLLESQARYARYSLFLISIACLVLGLISKQPSIKESIDLKRENDGDR